MDRINFSDWQNMAIKKDLEAILRAVTSHQSIVFSLCWEIAIALGSIIVDHLFDTEKAPSWLWIVTIVVAVGPVLCVVIYKAIQWEKTVRMVRSGVLSTKQYVDCFDNQVNYWIMMSNSYCDILEELSNKKNQQEEMIHIYQEGVFYINKSIYALDKMLHAVDKVFSFHEDEIVDSNLISFFRLISVLNMMKKNQSRLDNAVENIVNDPQLTAQRKLNQKYQEKLKRFLRKIDAEFESDISSDDEISTLWGKLYDAQSRIGANSTK